MKQVTRKELKQIIENVGQQLTITSGESQIFSDNWLYLNTKRTSASSTRVVNEILKYDNECTLHSNYFNEVNDTYNIID